MQYKISSGITPQGRYFTQISAGGYNLVKLTRDAGVFLNNLIKLPMSCRPETREITTAPRQNPFNKFRTGPAHNCIICKKPIYKGARIDGKQYFCNDHMWLCQWIDWYRTHTNKSDFEIAELKIECFTDDGITSTLL